MQRQLRKQEEHRGVKRVLQFLPEQVGAGELPEGDEGKDGCTGNCQATGRAVRSQGRLSRVMFIVTPAAMGIQSDTYGASACCEIAGRAPPGRGRCGKIRSQQAVEKGYHSDAWGNRKRSRGKGPVVRSLEYSRPTSTDYVP